MTETAVAPELLQEEWSGERPGDPGFWSAARHDAFERFSSAGLPTTRSEAWKYTSVAPIARESFAVARPEGAASLTPGFRPEGAVIAIVDGRYSPELSSVAAEPSLEVAGLDEQLQAEPSRLEGLLGGVATDRDNPFTALNTAFASHGVVIRIAAGAVVEAPIHVAYIQTSRPGEDPVAANPRTLIVAQKASQAQVVESFQGDPGARYLTNAVTEIVLEDGAIVEHYKLQRESGAAFHVATLAVRQARDSRFVDQSFCFGGQIARNDIDVKLSGPGAECALYGLFMGRGEQLMDTHSRIDHVEPHCSSRQLYKGVLDDASRGVFHGAVVVRPGAQKTDAEQSNRNLLLTREALVNSTPQLEIFADDVKCRHGATTGQLDKTALFYLRSRGISEEAARSMLTYGFASELVARVGVPEVSSVVRDVLGARLPGAPVAELR